MQKSEALNHASAGAVGGLLSQEALGPTERRAKVGLLRLRLRMETYLYVAAAAGRAL